MMNDPSQTDLPAEFDPDFDTEDWGDFAEDTYDPDFDLSGEFSDVAQGMYDDDPSPYFGDYSEM